MQKAINFNHAAIVSVKDSDYRTYLWCKSRDDAISIIKNSHLNEKGDYYKFPYYI